MPVSRIVEATSYASTFDILRQVAFLPAPVAVMGWA
jgi:hypothetical protein